MAQKSKCTKYELFPKKEGYDKQLGWVEMEDGKKGSTFDSFTAGEEYEYEFKEKPKDGGGVSVFIWKPKAKGAFKPKDYLGTIISTGTSYCVELFLHPDFIFGDMKLNEIIEVIVPPMIAKHNEVVTPREKEFISYAMRYAINVYENKDQRERFQKAMKLDGKDKEKELNLIVTIFRNILKNMLDVNKTLNV